MGDFNAEPHDHFLHDIFAEVLQNVFNTSPEVGEFPPGMKLENVTPVHKNEADMVKVIISLLAFGLTYQVFERCLHKQISDFFYTILSKYQCCFRKAHGAQHRLISLLQKWYRLRTRILYFPLTDLSEAFDCLPQDLINYLHTDLTTKHYALCMIV